MHESYCLINEHSSGVDVQKRLMIDDHIRRIKMAIEDGFSQEEPEQAALGCVWHVGSGYLETSARKHDG